MSYPIQKPILSSEKTQIRNSRMIFANFIAQRQQVNFGDKIFTPKFTASDVTTKNMGALFTTKEEEDLILNLPSTVVNDCPVNFNVANALYKANIGIDNFFKIVSIDGSNITLQVFDQGGQGGQGGYITLQYSLFELHSQQDWVNAHTAGVTGVYVNASSGIIYIGSGGNVALYPCGAAIIV